MMLDLHVFLVRWKHSGGARSYRNCICQGIAKGGGNGYVFFTDPEVFCVLH